MGVSVIDAIHAAKDRVTTGIVLSSGKSTSITQASSHGRSTRVQGRWPGLGSGRAGAAPRETPFPADRLYPDRGLIDSATTRSIVSLGSGHRPAVRPAITRSGVGGGISGRPPAAPDPRMGAPPDAEAHSGSTETAARCLRPRGGGVRAPRGCLRASGLRARWSELLHSDGSWAGGADAVPSRLQREPSITPDRIWNDGLFTATILDGIVVARSMFNSSLNFRSCVVLGQGRRVESLDEIAFAYETITDHLIPGRVGDTRPPTADELRQTSFIALPVEEFSVKVRAGGPVDDEEDLSLPFWAGVIPTSLEFGAPNPQMRRRARRPRTSLGTRVVVRRA